MDIITSLDNNTVKQARSLNDKKYRRHYGEFLVEGKKLVTEAIAKGLNITNLFVDSTRASEYENIITSCDAPVVFCAPNVFKSLTETVANQGIIAECELPAASLYNHHPNNKILVLDNISDPGNMGTIIRTAMATGFDNIFTIDCVDAYSPKVVRASSGGVFKANIYPFTADEVVELAKKNNITLLIADMSGENIFNLATKSLYNYAIVIGNEGHGVSQILKDAGQKISLPMLDGTESLNAGVSASVIMYLMEGKNL